MYLSDIYTISANLAGIPGISIPCGFTKAGLPIGLQILGAPFVEEKLLRVARMYERETEWHRRRPASGGEGEGEEVDVREFEARNETLVTAPGNGPARINRARLLLVHPALR